MNAHLLLPALLLSSFPLAPAKAPPVSSDDKMSAEVRAAINKFKASRGAAEKPSIESDNPAPVAELVAPEPSPTESQSPPADEVAPASPAPVAAPAVQAATETPEPPATETPEPPASLSVKVEKLQTGQGAIDPKSVTLHAPFPAKPLAAIPAGWHLAASTAAPPFLRTIELAPGASITLNIRPHLLAPDADTATTFAIAEPGFDSALGYRQAHTVGAVLAASIQQLDEDSKQLGNAIDQLQQLVMALPQPAAKPKPRTAPSRKP